MTEICARLHAFGVTSALLRQLDQKLAMLVLSFVRIKFSANHLLILIQAFKVFSNPKAEDIRMRAELNKLYMETDQVIHKLGDEIKEELGDVRGKIKSLSQQLKVKEYVVLIAGNSMIIKSVVSYFGFNLI